MVEKWLGLTCVPPAVSEAHRALRTEKSSNRGRARAGLSTPGSWEEALAPGAGAARHSKPVGFSSCLSVASTLLM